MLVITGLTIGVVIAFFLFKKSSHLLPIPDNLTTFDNPLFFSNEQSQPATNKLIETGKEENPEPVKTMW